jgi:hypothetical protein
VDLGSITLETLEEIKKAAATAGITSSSGITGIDLSDLVSLIPVNTPFFDQLAHETPTMGNTFAQWKALVNVNNTQPDPATAFDYAAPLVNLQELDVTAPYGKVGAGYTVTRDSIAIAGGYADAKAIAIANALNQWKIGMDKKSLGGQRFALLVPTGVTVVPASTGGTIPLSTAVPVRVAARTGSNYSYGGSTAAAATVSATTGSGTSTNSAVSTCVAVRGAVAYDWFVNGFYYTTTTVNKVTITSIPTSNNAVPPLPGLYSVAPAAVPTVDSSAKPNDFNGLLATLAGDYATGGATGLVTPGSGTPSGAAFQSLDGNPFTVSGQSIIELDNINQLIYNAVNLSPDAYMVSSQTASEMSSAILSTAGGGTTFYAPNLDGRTEAVAGAFIGYYVNKAAGGQPVKVEVMPNMAPGTLIARTDSVPFPNSGITKTVALRDLDPVYSYEYGSARLPGQAGGGPREDGENLSLTTLINRAPVAMGFLSNIG